MIKQMWIMFLDSRSQAKEFFLLSLHGVQGPAEA